MEVGSIVICITLGSLICFVFFGVGVCFGRDSKEQSNGDSCVHSSADVRSGNRCGHNVQDIPNEALATIVDGMVVTGISPTSFEKECLKEAAERLRGDIDDGK